jgi:ribokinase
LQRNPSEYLVVKGVKELEPILEASNLLIFNKEEAFILSKKKTMTEAFKFLITQIKKEGIVVITDGPRGAYAYDGENILYAKPKPVKILETTGAGDAFASGFTAAIIRGGNINAALKSGMIQAESVIRCYGAKNKLLNHREMNEALKKDKRQILIKKI